LAVTVLTSVFKGMLLTIKQT